MRGGGGRGRTTVLVGAMTVLVALAGYMREAAIAARFGVSSVTDAYFAAIFIPNTLYLVLVAGTLSPVFIPILLQRDASEGRAGASEVFSNITNFVFVILLTAIVAGTGTASLWMRFLFPGFSPEVARLSVELTSIIFPAVLFLGIAGLFTAVLNGFDRFRLAAFAPAVASLSVIAGVLLARGSRAVFTVAIATAVGFLLQCVILIPAVKSVGIRWRPILKVRDPAIAKVLRLGIPLFGYLAIGNASLFIERNLASQVSTGAVAIVSYAIRVFMVPANFLVAPLATVAYPQFAREAARPEHGELPAYFTRMLRLLVFLFLPVTLWAIMNALPVVRLLYQHGNFRAQDSVITAEVLAIYSAAILPYAVSVLALRCYFALEDTVTPMLTELITLGGYMIAAGPLSRRMGLPGLAITRSVTFFLVAIILYSVLARRLRLFRIRGVGLGAKTMVASAAMGIASWLVLHWAMSAFDSPRTAVRFAALALDGVVSAFAFLVTAMLLRIPEARHLMTTVLQFLRPAPEAASAE